MSAFNAGFAAAVAMLARDHREDGLAWYLLEAAGADLSAYAGVDEFDLAVVRKLFAENTKASA